MASIAGPRAAADLRARQAPGPIPFRRRDVFDVTSAPSRPGRLTGLARLAATMFLGCAVLRPGSTGLLRAQEPTTATPDAQLAAGTRVRSPSTGIEFSVPNGFSGAFDPDAQGIVLQNSSGIVLGVWAVSWGAASDLADAVGRLLIEQGLQLRRRGEPETVEGITIAELDALSRGGRLRFVAAMQNGEAGNAIVAAAMSPAEAGLRSLAEEVVRGADLGAPADVAWLRPVEGVRLTRSGIDGAKSPTAGASGPHPPRTTAELSLCRNGRYAFRSGTESSTSGTDDGSPEPTGGEAHEGHWRIMADLVGRVFLVLQDTEGNAYTWAAEETPEGAAINGTPYVASPVSC